jgi:hypothetical protein
MAACLGGTTVIRYGMWNVRVETSTHTCARRVLPQLICRARAPDILLVVEWTINALALLAGLGPANNLFPDSFCARRKPVRYGTMAAVEALCGLTPISVV